MFKKLFSALKGNNKEVKTSVVVEKEGKVYAVQTGEAIDLAQVPDEVFASKVLGEGFAIIPTEGKVYSPVSGEIVSVVNTLHAYGIRTASGLEVLVHIGLETVKLNGEGFKAAVKVGDKVKAGDLLAEVDLAWIEEKGCKRHTPVILTNIEEGALEHFTPGQVVGGETVVMEYTVK